MFPTCSNSDLAGRNALSATDLTMVSSSGPPGAADGRRVFDGVAARHRQLPASPSAGIRPPSRGEPGGNCPRGGMFPAPWGRRTPQAPTHRIGSEALVRVPLSCWRWPRSSSASRPAATSPGRTPTSPRASSRWRSRRRSSRPTSGSRRPATCVSTSPTSATRRCRTWRSPSTPATRRRRARSRSAPTSPASRTPTDRSGSSRTSSRSASPTPATSSSPTPRPAACRRPRPTPRAASTRQPAAGADAAQTDTFSFGELEPNDDIEMVWRLTPVVAGTYTVHYQLAAGLTGKAKAVTADGGPVEGELVVTVSDKPPQSSVSRQRRGRDRGRLGRAPRSLFFGDRAGRTDSILAGADGRDLRARRVRRR